ncbi:helix-turn-helix domain-containing GNAT family N-acetyltransferase [Spirosoma sp. KNUC1025]|uniref:bifunctional helix-turn-helix transcriptional regulator/GNAT family N-acetyltransferase n=1 Tax=Spirosoma sp. KNUC1025 TaxID=2894082 RepID=UPI00386D30DE|nr:helix-turn-helix domain-containing GNAT family N-acetyltransferase [Spirosoma sp. KNUC1025]
MSAIADVRAFNRFYTNVIGVVDRHVLNSSLSLAEARVLFEIRQQPHCTQTHLIEQLTIDAGYLSRIIKRFEREGLITRHRSDTDGRASYLVLTDPGQALFQTLSQESEQELSTLTSHLSSGQLSQLVNSMQTIKSLLSTPSPRASINIRHELQSGDLGLITQYHGLWYGPEFGYDLTFEGYVAQTLGEFANTYSPKKDRVWIAEADGRFIGSIAVVGRSGNVGQLRWFILDKAFRGQGLGKRLVDLTLAFCRECGYKSMYLLTTADQTTAHHLYKRVGFSLTEEHAPVQRWGQTLREQRYEITL